MKRLLLLAGLCAFTWTSYAQSGTGWGLKGGLNFNANGNLIEAAGQVIENPDRSTGFHLGIWGKLGNSLYLRPELVFTNTTSRYDSGDFKMNKLDLPLLGGIKVIGPLHLFIGPSFQIILDTKFDEISIEDIDNTFTVGLNVGAGVNLGRIGIDLRYERGFTKNEARFIDRNITEFGTNRIDTRPDQIILSLSVRL